jgi:hypothetical protein
MAADAVRAGASQNAAGSLDGPRGKDNLSLPAAPYSSSRTRPRQTRATLDPPETRYSPSEMPRLPTRCSATVKSTPSASTGSGAISIWSGRVPDSAEYLCRLVTDEPFKMIAVPIEKTSLEGIGLRTADDPLTQLSSGEDRITMRDRHPVAWAARWGSAGLLGVLSRSDCLRNQCRPRGLRGHRLRNAEHPRVGETSFVGLKAEEASHLNLSADFRAESGVAPRLFQHAETLRETSACG